MSDQTGDSPGEVPTTMGAPGLAPGAGAVVEDDRGALPDLGRVSGEGRSAASALDLATGDLFTGVLSAGARAGARGRAPTPP